MKVLSTWLGVFQQPVYSNIILNLHICSNNKRLTEGVSQWERLAGRKERRRPDFLLPLLFYSDIKLLYHTVFHHCVPTYEKHLCGCFSYVYMVLLCRTHCWPLLTVAVTTLWESRKRLTCQNGLVLGPSVCRCCWSGPWLRTFPVHQTTVGLIADCWPSLGCGNVR